MISMDITMNINDHSVSSSRFYNFYIWV